MSAILDGKELHPPLMISARLLPAVKIAGAWISIEETDDTNRDGKPAWRWYVDLPDGTEHTDSDLHGWGNEREMLGSLLSFLDACGESLAYAGEDGDNADLFPRPVGLWAEENRDEIGMVRLELEEGGAGQ
jgi:hypothetical protein